MDPIAKHWCEYIERICANSALVEQAQGITPQATSAYKQFLEDCHKTHLFLSHLQSLVDGKMHQEGQVNG